MRDTRLISTYLPNTMSIPRQTAYSPVRSWYMQGQWTVSAGPAHKLTLLATSRDDLLRIAQDAEDRAARELRTAMLARMIADGETRSDASVCFE